MYQELVSSIPKNILNFFLLTVFSLLIGLEQGLLNIDDLTFKTMMEERKKLIPELIINPVKK